MDDDNTGRLTPGGRAKRPKQHHHHQYVSSPFALVLTAANLGPSHHHHHHHHPTDLPAAQGAGTTPFKNIKGGALGPSPNDKNVPGTHHHHVTRPIHPHHVAAKQPSQTTPVIPPKSKTIISSKAVLEAVANRPRNHLGDFIYEPGLKAQRLIPTTPMHRAFASNPKPLPWDLIKDKENCTLTVKVGKSVV